MKGGFVSAVPTEVLYTILHTNIVIPLSRVPFVLSQLRRGPPKTRLQVFIPLLCYLLRNACGVLHHGIVYSCLKASWFSYYKSWCITTSSHSFTISLSTHSLFYALL